MLAEPIMQAELTLARKIETHNRRLEALNVGNYTLEERTLIEEKLFVNQQEIKKRIELLGKAKRAKKAMDELREKNPSLPMEDEIDMVLSTGITARIEELAKAVESTDFPDESGFPPQLTA